MQGWALRKGRFSESGRLYLITTVTQARHPLFLDYANARAVVAALRAIELAGRAETYCYVVMPDHLHLHWLMALAVGADLSRVLQSMKSFSAKAINSRLGTRGPVWQSGYHDHALRAEEDVLDVARYVVANPVRAGLVSRAGDYPYWDARWL